MNTQDLEQRALEFLAAEYERDGKAGSAHHIRTQPLQPNKARAVRAIAAALRQQSLYAAPLSKPVDRRAARLSRRGKRPRGVLCVEPGAPLKAAQDPKGLTVKQAWWAGYRAGKSLPPETPRHAALRHQPAPVDLEQFREIAEGLHLADQFFDGDDSHWQWDDGEFFPASKVRAAHKRLLSIIDNAGKVEPACEVRLWDSQWVNIVNAPEVLDASDREEAVNIAVRMTERAIAQNVASSNLPPAPHQPAPVVDDTRAQEPQS